MSEYGGDPLWIDDVAYGVRSFDWSGPDWVDENITITKKPQLTSFGNVSIQIRRALSMLGYSSTDSKGEAAVIDSLTDHVEGIYMAAKHARELKDVDFSDIAPALLTDEEISYIATRYNRGLEISLDKVKENNSYGNNIINNMENIAAALNQE